MKASIDKRDLLTTALVFFGCLQPLLFPAQEITQGMVNPNIDPPGEPFSYFTHPTDEISTLFAPVGSEVTPEGYVWTGFGELMLFVGNPPEPINVRIKTLHNGYLPMIQYHLAENGVRYEFTAFASNLGGGLEGMPVNFVEVKIKNQAPQARAAFLSSAYRFRGPVNVMYHEPDYRFRQAFGLIPKEYVEGQNVFNPHWQYSYGKDTLVRDGRDIYFYPTTTAPYRFLMSLRDEGVRGYRYMNGKTQTVPLVLSSDPDTAVGLVMYRLVLKPGESHSLVFKVPIAPLPERSAEARQVEEADYATNFQKTVAFWEDLVGKSPTLRFPETRVQDFLLSNTVYNLLAIDKRGNDYVPTDAKLVHHGFYGGGNTADVLMGLDYAGLADIAKKALLYSLTAQRDDGAFSFEKPYQRWESFGYSLWAWGLHYQLTHDAEFLHQIYPGVVKAMGWENRVTTEDPLGLVPICDVWDDAALAGVHQTGQSIWTLVGLKAAIRLAQAMDDKQQDVERFQAEYDRYWNAFEKQLAMQTAKTGGYIPPALDGTLLGNDWDNLLTLWPEPLFEPFDPRVTATIRESRARYSEGILGYVSPQAVGKQGDEIIYNTEPMLHYWQTQDNAENALVRGGAEDQRLAIKDLYATLLHTTSTHMCTEFSTYPWSTRDIKGNDMPPDGAVQGKTVELLRNMLVREYKNDLYLFSAVSPAWLKAGKTIEVVNEPTEFGPVSAILTANATGWEVKLSNHFRQAPARVVVRVPWFYQVEAAQVDGRPVKVTGGDLVVSANAREVKVKGGIKPGTPAMSFERTVEDYKREYQRRYDNFLQTGVTRP